jgi:hypothetical protein
MGDLELDRDQCLGRMAFPQTASPQTILPCSLPLVDSQNPSGRLLLHLGFHGFAYVQSVAPAAVLFCLLLLHAVLPLSYDGFG